MKYELLRRVGTRGIAAALGLCVAAVLSSGAQAVAAKKSTTTTTETPQAAAAMAIIPESAYVDALLQLGLRGVAHRGDDPVLRPADAGTRAQMAVYIYRTLTLVNRLQLPEGQTMAFTDVPASSWAYDEIKAVVAAGLMKGTSPTTFSPDLPISRQEAVAAVLAAGRYPSGDPDALSRSMAAYEAPDWLGGFHDRNLIDAAYVEPLATAVKLQWFDMPTEGWLLPKLGLTHLEMLVLLDRAFVEAPEPLVTRVAIETVDAVDAYPTLSKGSKGPLVLFIQQRLNAMTYYCGKPDGKFSAQTRDAVYAFEKYWRIKRVGKADATFWETFWTATTPVPVFPGDPGKRVETDLTRQIMMLIRDNEVFMTVHVSTGKYGTPTGDWHIRTRSRTWRPTSLGPVFAPCYFMARNAIHGYPSVPTYPASHNCIRTPIWIQLKIVDELEMGELVHVFNNKLEPAP